MRKVSIKLSMIMLIVTSKLLILLVAIPGFSQESDELSIILEGCRVAVESVKTGKGNVTVEYSKNGKTIFEATSRYSVAFSGNRFRISEDALYLRNDPTPELTSDQVKLLIPAGTRLLVEYMRSTDDVIAYWHLGDRAKITTMLLPTGRSLDDYFRLRTAIVGHGVLRIDTPGEDASIRIAGYDMVGEDECTVIEKILHLPIPNGETATLTQLFWVNPSKGFTVPRQQVWAQGGTQVEKALAMEINTDLKHYGNGVWGPLKWTCQTYRRTSDGERVTDFRIVATYDPDFRINSPVEGQDLVLTLPSGTAVQDELLGEHYTVP